MTLITPLTELDAVNELLASIGQAPVNTVTNSGISDVNIALSELKKVARFVQLEGFAFNTDDAYELIPNITGDIAVPTGVLRLKACDPNRKITTRRNPAGQVAVYDADNQTFHFDAPIKARVVWGFSFEDLPESARAYITISAARKFQARFLGSRELDGFNALDEQRAWAMLKRDERAASDNNSFRQSASLQRGYYRGGALPHRFP